VDRVINKPRRRISSVLNLKPVTPEDYPVDWDISQQEMRMLFRARPPKTFDLNDLLKSSIYSSYVHFNLSSHLNVASQFAARRQDLRDKCPVEVSTILRMFPTWSETGLWGNIAVKNVSDHLLTFRVRNLVEKIEIVNVRLTNWLFYEITAAFIRGWKIQGDSAEGLYWIPENREYSGGNERRERGRSIG